MSKFDLSGIPAVFHNGKLVPKIYMNGVLVWESNAKIIDYVYRSPEYITADMEVFIVFENTSDGTYWAVSNNNGTLSAPTAVQLPINNITGGSILVLNANDLIWVVEYNLGVVKFRKKDSETEYLYTTNTNNGVRVGEFENNEFDYADYLQHIATGRFLYCYNNQEIRARTSNDSYVEQSGRFYVLEISEQE